VSKNENNIVETLKEDLINILYPRTCPICGKILKINNLQICVECKTKLKYINEPACKKCGKQLLLEEQEYCYDCFCKPHQFTRGIALCSQEEWIKKSIYNFKYNNKREYAKIYANEIVLRYKNRIESWNADVLIPIPLHQSKMRSRGFNQAEDLCRELSSKLHIPMSKDSIKRVKKTLPQKELNDKERIKNLKKAFKIDGIDVKSKRVILIDDIYTTGSTIDSVAAILKNFGVSEIYFITISIGEGL
jgi:ComF family protein